MAKMKKLIITEVEKQIIEDYCNGLSSLKLSTKYCLSKNKILKILKENNINRRTNKICVSDEKKDLIVKLYKEGKKINDIVFETGLKEKKIYEVLNEKKIVKKLNSKISNEIKENICKDFLNGKTFKELMDLYNIKSDGTISKILKEYDIKVNKKIYNKIPLEIKEKIINEYLNGLNICELHEIYGYGTTTIARWLKEKNLTRTLSDAFTLSAQKGRKHFKGTTLPWFSTKSKKWFIADSMWEVVRMNQLDNDTSVCYWEKCKDRIKYVDDNNLNHYYMPDFTICYTNNLIVVEEIKPSIFVKDKINQIKFNSAKKFYSKKNIVFKVVTENDIGIDNIKNFNTESMIKYTKEIRDKRRKELRNERERNKRRKKKEIGNN